MHTCPRPHHIFQNLFFAFNIIRSEHVIVYKIVTSITLSVVGTFGTKDDLLPTHNVFLAKLVLFRQPAEVNVVSGERRSPRYAKIVHLRFLLSTLVRRRGGLDLIHNTFFFHIVDTSAGPSLQWIFVVYLFPSPSASASCPFKNAWVSLYPDLARRIRL